MTIYMPHLSATTKFAAIPSSFQFLAASPCQRKEGTLICRYSHVGGNAAALSEAQRQHKHWWHRQRQHKMKVTVAAAVVVVAAAAAEAAAAAVAAAWLQRGGSGSMGAAALV